MPVLLIEQVKVDTPTRGVDRRLAAQVRVPPPGLVPMAREMEADDVVTTLPRESSTDTPSVKLVPATERRRLRRDGELGGVPARIDSVG